MSKSSVLNFIFKNIQKLFLFISLSIFFFIPVSAYACTVTASPSTLPSDNTNTLVTFNVINNNSSNWVTTRITLSSPLNVDIYGQQTPIVGWNADTFIGGLTMSGRGAEWISSNFSTYFIPSNTNFSFSTNIHTTQDLPLTLQLVHLNDNTGTMVDLCDISLPVVHTNNPPSINPISNTTINEGDTYSENGSFTDSDSTSWAATVDYGDGGGSQPLTLSGTNFSLSHQYKDNGTYTVTVRVTDNQGATGTGTATITVNNVAPTIDSITASVNPVQVNNSITASANFTDPGVLDTHNNSGTYWNWGDGNTTTGTVTETNGSGSVSDSHTYTSAGVYLITLYVTDKDGGAGTQTFQYLSVYNPTAQGLFSAAEKYTSPVGAYAANTSLTGNVLFGLSYKYQGSVPTGNREFSMDFNAANFHFNATSVSSLVISNGIGTLTGTGSLNGSGTYNFLVTGSESANTIRIQIKDSSGNVVYDTQPSTADTATPTTSVTGNVLAH